MKLNRRLIVEILAVLLMITLIVLASKHDISACKETLKECNEYVQNECFSIEEQSIKNLSISSLSGIVRNSS